MRYKFLNGVSMAIVAITLTVAVVATAMMHFPLRPFELFGPFAVKTPIVERGGVLIYTAQYCKADGVGAGRVARTLVDGLLYNLPETYGTVAEGCHSIDIATEIPSAVPTGTYHMKIHATYQINLIRTVTATAETESFVVR